jgi:hypothetical protein
MGAAQAAAWRRPARRRSRCARRARPSHARLRRSASDARASSPCLARALLRLPLRRSARRRAPLAHRSAAHGMHGECRQPQRAPSARRRSMRASRRTHRPRGPAASGPAA